MTRALAVRRLVAWLGLVSLLAGCATLRQTETAPVEAPPAATDSRPRTQAGRASWYGQAHHGRQTASGEIYDMYRLTAAHPTLPLGTRVLVTNLRNGRSVEVRVNDRGPYVDGRIIDLSYAAARELAALSDGVVSVRLRVLPP